MVPLFFLLIFGANSNIVLKHFDIFNFLEKFRSLR